MTFSAPCAGHGAPPYLKVPPRAISEPTVTGTPLEPPVSRPRTLPLPLDVSLSLKAGQVGVSWVGDAHGELLLVGRSLVPPSRPRHVTCPGHVTAPSASSGHGGSTCALWAGSWSSGPRKARPGPVLWPSQVGWLTG
jgi:hypothetical protein